MLIKNNPFYILGASTRDSKQKIIELCELKSIVSDEKACSEARLVLTNPKKRLSAEIRWFSGISPKKVNEIIGGLNDDDLLDRNISSLEGLPKLTLLIEKLSHPKENILEFGYLIIDIDQAYEDISVEHIRNLLNEDRTSSGFPLIENVQLIENELQQLQLEIKELINVETIKLPFDEYVELITLLADNCINEESYNYSAILDGIIDDYELKTKAKLEAQADAIRAKIKYINENIQKINLKSEVSLMINLVREFDKTSQPLQLNARAKGIKHLLSENVAKSIHTFAVALTINHNEIECTALIINEMKSRFAELEELFETLEKDSAKVDELKEEYRLMEEHNRENKSYQIKIEKDSVTTPMICVCCAKPTDNTEQKFAYSSVDSGNKRYTKTVNATIPICNECKTKREYIERINQTKAYKLMWLSLLIIVGISIILLLMGVDVAVSVWMCLIIPVILFAIFAANAKIFYPNLDQSTLSNILASEYIRIFPYYNGKESYTTYVFKNWLFAKKFAEANGVGTFNDFRKSRPINFRKRNILGVLKSKKKIYWPTVLLSITMAIFIGVLGTPTSTAQTSSVANSSVMQTKNNPVSNNSANSNDKYYSSNDFKSEQLKKQIDEKKGRLDQKESEVQQLESQLTSLNADLDQYKKNYEDTGNESWRTKYNDAVDRHNNILSQYNTAYNEYEQMLSEYNSLVDQYNSLLYK